MFCRITTFPFPGDHREKQWARRLGKAALVLGFIAQCTWAQPGAAASPEHSRQTSESGVAGSKTPAVSVGAASTLQAPALPATEVHPLPASSVEMLANRIDALAKTVESATSVSKPPVVDPWQDTKSIVLNVISNRIDSWLFGDGKGSVGSAAQIVAALALVIALVRFMLAVAMLNPATPPTKWGRFKAWSRKSGVVRGINVVVGALAVVFTGAALYVVVSARAAPDISQASITALQESLTACQSTLSNKPRQQQLPALPPPLTGPLPGLESMESLTTRCESAIRATEPRLSQIEESIASIDSKQPWAITKIIAFFAWIYLLIAVTLLLFHRLTK